MEKYNRTTLVQSTTTICVEITVVADDISKRVARFLTYEIGEYLESVAINFTSVAL